MKNDLDNTRMQFSKFNYTFICCANKKQNFDFAFAFSNT